MRASISQSRLLRTFLVVGLLSCFGALCAGPLMAQTASKSPAPQAVRSPSDTVREFYKAMHEKRFREAFDLTIYKPAIDPLKPQEFEELRPDFEKMALAIPLQVELGGEQISGDIASVFVKVKEGDKPEQLEP
ncbi:MAG TPA: hypothetical protein VE977_06815, partial [Pyrinomonadaceae bacterium]|nr:hypothetical protein [Pyrinomonadaceae bacterium]